MSLSRMLTLMLAARASRPPADEAIDLHRAQAQADQEPALMPTLVSGFGVAWVIFWLLMTAVEVQDYWRQGGNDLWKPILWVGSSMLVATAVAWLQRRRLVYLDTLIATPWRWFVASVVWLPVAAPLFVTLVYALRHAVYALLGLRYQHASWSTVFTLEIFKFTLFYLMFAAIVFGIRSYAALNEAQLRLEREQRLTQRAQLLQLAQQIEPHFLFNALSTIAETIHSDPNLADALLTRLATLLRTATDLARKPEGTLDEELYLLEAYAAIMRQRFADRVSVEFDIDPQVRNCRLPSLIVQPLLENAFRHAVEPHSHATKVVLRAKQAQGRLCIEVQDDSGELPPDQNFGVGLSNLRQRLQTRYGANASLVLARRDPSGVIARLEMPCEF